MVTLFRDMASRPLSRSTQYGEWLITGRESFGRWLPTSAGRLRLTAEVMPDGRWEWLVWLPAVPARCRSGLSRSAAAAMADAERVARAGAFAATGRFRKAIGQESRPWARAS